MKLLILVTIAVSFGCSHSEPQPSYLARRDGDERTIRRPLSPKADDPKTTNDETNDQPLGHFGTKTLFARNENSGNSYPLDAEIAESDTDAEYYLERFYFQKGGHVDFADCILDADLTGTCQDESLTQWQILGEYR